MKTKYGNRCNITGVSIFNKEHQEECLECRSRAWDIEHPILVKVKLISFGILLTLGFIGFIVTCLKLYG